MARSTAFAIFLSGVIANARSVPGNDTAGAVIATSGSYLGYSPNIGNGYLATHPATGMLHVNGIYNGNGEPASYPDSHSHRADIEAKTDASISVSMSLPDSNESFALNMSGGFFAHSWDGGVWWAQHRAYAHRSRPHVFVTEIVGENFGTEDIELHVRPAATEASKDLRVLQRATRRASVNEGVWQTIEEEEKGSGLFDVALVWDDLPSSLKLEAKSGEQQWVFLTTVVTSLTDQDPLSVAKTEHSDALAASRELFQEHTVAWTELWAEGRIELRVEPSSLELAQLTWSSQYNILVCTRADWPYGTSPWDLGLRGEEYWGQVFWDSALWEYPPTLLHHPELGRAAVEYRYQRIDGAQIKARKNGQVGTMFPWQSAVTGQEMDFGQWGQYEHHISGDIAFAARQYWAVSRDKSWLNSRGWPLVSGIAEFYAGRVSKVSSQEFGVFQVMGPDEYNYPVDNSAFVNYVAALALDFAQDVADIVEHTPGSNWSTITKGLCVPTEDGYHPEFEGYKRGKQVKQADTILLGFPLMMPMSPELRRADLEAYEAHTDEDGPAMTWGAFAIGWLEINETSRGDSMFKKQYSGNVVGPWQCWQETAGSTGPGSFNTAAGGYLQALENGYGGLRMTVDSLELAPRLPPGSTSLLLAGVHFAGCALDIEATPETVTVRQVKAGELGGLVVFGSDGSSHDLSSGPLVLPAQEPPVKVSVRLAAAPEQSRPLVPPACSSSPSPGPAPSPPPSPSPTPTPPSPSVCPSDSDFVPSLGGECLWSNGSHGLLMPRSPRQYCDYFDQGYFGYTWDLTEGDHDCAGSAQKSQTATTGFCVWQDGSSGVAFPPGSSADCDSLGQGRIGLRLSGSEPLLV